jgi:hypothetical protein
MIVDAKITRSSIPPLPTAPFANSWGLEGFDVAVLEAMTARILKLSFMRYAETLSLSDSALGLTLDGRGWINSLTTSLEDNRSLKSR